MGRKIKRRNLKETYGSGAKPPPFEVVRQPGVIRALPGQLPGHNVRITPERGEGQRMTRSEMESKPCDGNHGAPNCGRDECWQGDSLDLDLERAEGEGMPPRPDMENRIQIAGPALRDYAKEHFPEGVPSGLIVDLAIVEQDTSARDQLDRALDQCAGWLDSPVMSEEDYAEALRTALGWDELDDVVDDSEAVMTAPVSQDGAFTAEELAANCNFQAPNFRDKAGKFQLVKCFYCRPEGRGNLAPATARGICNWCGARGK